MIRRALFAVALFAAFPLAGCTTEAYCFRNCGGENQASGGSPSGGSGGQAHGGTGGSILGGSGGCGVLGCAGTGGSGGATCNADVTKDPHNCGACGHVCPTPLGTVPTCTSGQCGTTCAEGFVDLDKDPSTGCEYQCPVVPKAAETCNGKDDDCNGKVDDGVAAALLQDDPKNCGGCNVVCADVPNAVVTCEKGVCKNTCKPGFSGQECAYACPVQPPVAEVCNGKDDDCDGAIDDGSPGAGMPCESNCPGGKCVGECKPGTTLCSGTAKGLLCTGGVGPTIEVCDGKDNDCNGVVDDGFDLQTDPANCGSCGVACAAGDLCSGGKCQFTCAACTRDLDKIPSNHCEYACPAGTCDPATDKVTGVETCNGVDDDCNGLVDDALMDPAVGVPCATNCPPLDPCVAAGTCSSPSTCDGSCCGVCAGTVTTCTGGQVVCNPPATFQATDPCNGLDDNCDGRIDEGFDLATDPLNCGACGNACSEANAVAACQAGACVIFACKPGFADLDGDPSNGCEYGCPQPVPGPEICDGIDNDCNGLADEQDPGLIVPPDPCKKTPGTPCEGTVWKCEGGAGFLCTYGPDVELDQNGVIRAVEAKCDGKDGNCDGNVDETWALLGASCTDANVGACQGKGQYACNGAGDNVACSITAPGQAAPAPETCNGVDDDCNGLVDDALPDSAFAMVPVGGSSTALVDTFEASRPDATALSGGTLSAVACSKPGVLPWNAVPYAQAKAACQARGPKYRLCTAAELATACSASGATTYPYGSTYQPTTCNGADAGNPSAIAATGAFSGCLATDGAADLSGNVTEWTSTQTGTTKTTPDYAIYQLHGGGYLSPAAGLACTIALAPRAAENAVLEDIGFRCCKDP